MRRYFLLLTQLSIPGWDLAIRESENSLREFLSEQFVPVVSFLYNLPFRPLLQVDSLGSDRELAEALDIALAELGWQTSVVWECETKSPETITERLVAFLEE